MTKPEKSSSCTDSTLVKAALSTIRFDSYGQRRALLHSANSPSDGHTGATSKGLIPMKFSDFVSTKSICADLNSEDKESVIAELVDSLLEAGDIKAADRDDIIKAIMKREELGSTGIGRGIAVPHTKHPSVNKLVGTVGVSSGGVEFESLDGEKVQLFFLLVSPPDRPGDHLRALENISRQLRDETFCRFLKQSKNADDIVQLLEEADNNQFVS
jgi:mannitol/fructose-specific phosphotransferase system IIA component (Ntr-type)